MRLKEAEEEAKRLNKHDDLEAKVVRTLPKNIDPPRAGDNGWDVEVTVLD